MYRMTMYDYFQVCNNKAWLVSYECHWYRWYGMGILVGIIQFIAAENMPTPLESRKNAIKSECSIRMFCTYCQMSGLLMQKLAMLHLVVCFITCMAYE